MSHVALPPANYAELEQGKATPIEGSGWEDLFSFIRFEPKLCYNNAVKVVMANEGRGLRYVLGYICNGDLATNFYIAHAWVETPDGLILDPTLDLATIDDVERESEPFTYFPCARLDDDYLNECLDATQEAFGAMYAPDHENVSVMPDVAAKLKAFEACDGLTRMINHIGHDTFGWDQATGRFTKKDEG